MTFQFRPANRSQAKPLIGLYSESSCGKTYSALLLARGFVGPTGKIGMIETESGRGEAYAKILPGSYDVLPLRDNFSPIEYGNAITLAEKSGIDALIIDSASHEWEGAGGVLDMAASNNDNGKKGVLAWQKPKTLHQQHFMLRLMQTPIPLVIVCMRAKYPMKEIVKPNGKKEWARSEELHPKQSEDILFEMFVHAWIDKQHNIHVTKYTLPDLASVIEDGKPITIETGERLAVWANGEEAPISDGMSGEDMVRAGREAAGQGASPFRDWWNTPGAKAARSILKPHLGEFQRIAAEADAGATEDDEDPFAGGADEPDRQEQLPSELPILGARANEASCQKWVSQAIAFIKGMTGDEIAAFERVYAETLTRIEGKHPDMRNELQDAIDLRRDQIGETEPSAVGADEGGDAVNTGQVDAIAPLELPRVTNKSGSDDWQAWADDAIHNIGLMDAAQIDAFKEKHDDAMQRLTDVNTDASNALLEAIETRDLQLAM